MTRATSQLLAHAADGGRITADEALRLYTDAPLHALGEAADAVRGRRYPDNIATHVMDRNGLLCSLVADLLADRDVRAEIANSSPGDYNVSGHDN